MCNQNCNQGRNCACGPRDCIDDAADEIEQLRKLAQDAYSAWNSDQETKVGKLLRAMLDGGFRKTYRPDLVTPNAGVTGAGARRGTGVSRHIRPPAR